MADNKPVEGDRKLRLIGPAILAVAVVAVLVLIFVIPERETPPPDPVADAPPTPAEPPAPVPALARADILAAAQAAAATYLAPASVARQEDLAGRSFSLRIPFGCDGAAVRPIGAQVFTEYDPAQSTMKLVAHPADWARTPPLDDLVSSGSVEAVEGFWLPRPWSAAESCPAPRGYIAPANSTPPASQTVGLAQVFEPGASRVMRRGGRAYEFVQRLDPADPAAPTRSYALALEGRVGRFPGGSTFRCWQESSEHRPVCLLAVVFSRIAFLDGSGGTLAEWRG